NFVDDLILGKRLDREWLARKRVTKANRAGLVGVTGFEQVVVFFHGGYASSFCGLGRLDDGILTGIGDGLLVQASAAVDGLVVVGKVPRTSLRGMTIRSRKVRVDPPQDALRDILADSYQ